MARHKNIYYDRLAKMGLLEKAKQWLKKNPPPKNWSIRWSKWAWAYTEMPVLFEEVKEYLRKLII